MVFTFADSNNAADIKQLLAENGLHYEDITPPMLGHFLLGHEGSQLVGVVGLEIKSPFALLRSLAVDTRFRRRGIATELVQRIEYHARSLNTESLYLLTMTAEQFFQKRGYRCVQRDSAPGGIQETAEFEALCPASAVCMAKRFGKGCS